jgi:hypothetical protein
VDHAVLKRLLRCVIKDERVLDLVDVIVDHGALDGAPGKGLPIGSLTSQHLANFYLAPLDHFVKEGLGVRRYVRYMDDLLLFGNAKADLWEWSRRIGGFPASELRLALKPAATVMAPVSEGVPFLGVRIRPALWRLSRRRKTRFLRAMRRLADAPTAAAVASAAGALEAARPPFDGLRPLRARRTLRPRPGRDPLPRSRARRGPALPARRRDEQEGPARAGSAGEPGVERPGGVAVDSRRRPTDDAVVGWSAATNMNSPEIEKLASEVAKPAGETPTEAVRRALEERRSRLARRPRTGDRAERLRRFLEAEVWPLVPPEERRRRLSREEEDALLGLGEDGT